MKDQIPTLTSDVIEMLKAHYTILIYSNIRNAGMLDSDALLQKYSDIISSQRRYVKSSGCGIVSNLLHLVDYCHNSRVSITSQ